MFAEPLDLSIPLPRYSCRISPLFNSAVENCVRRPDETNLKIELGNNCVVRKHYYFRPNGDQFDAWDVERLVELASNLPVLNIPLSSIDEIDSVYWIGADGSSPTVRILVHHMELVNSADLSFPVIIGADGRVMDGMHRIAKSLLLGNATVRAVRFDEQPSPDHVGITPQDLPYD
jgi:hypothetical protein